MPICVRAEAICVSLEQFLLLNQFKMLEELETIYNHLKDR
jgi:hypothetical protein